MHKGPPEVAQRPPGSCAKAPRKLGKPLLAAGKSDVGPAMGVGYSRTAAKNVTKTLQNAADKNSGELLDWQLAAAKTAVNTVRTDRLLITASFMISPWFLIGTDFGFGLALA